MSKLQAKNVCNAFMTGAEVTAAPMLWPSSPSTGGRKRIRRRLNMNRVDERLRAFETHLITKWEKALKTAEYKAHRKLVNLSDEIEEVRDICRQRLEAKFNWEKTMDKEQQDIRRQLKGEKEELQRLRRLIKVSQCEFATLHAIDTNRRQQIVEYIRLGDI